MSRLERYMTTYIYILNFNHFELMLLSLNKEQNFFNVFHFLKFLCFCFQIKTYTSECILRRALWHGAIRELC